MLEFAQAAWGRFVSSDALIAAVITALIPAILYGFSRWVAPKIRLRYGIVSNMIMLPKRPDGSQGTLRVQRLRFWNAGKKGAEELQIIFNWKPQHIEQYPHIAERDELKVDGRYIVHVPRLNGGESFDISVASDEGELPAVIYVRAKGAIGKVVQFHDQIKYSLPVNITVAILMLFGLFAFVYLLVTVGSWILFGSPT